MKKKHTVSGNILKNSFLILLLFVLGIIVIVAGIFPKYYIEQQKKLNSDILLRASKNLQNVLEETYLEYLSIANDGSIIESLKEIRYYSYAEKSANKGDNIKYINAYKMLSQNINEVCFLSSNIVSDFFYIVDDSIVHTSVDSDLIALKNYINQYEKDETLFLCTSEVQDYYKGKTEFLICFPIYESNGKVLSKICFILNNEKKYVVLGEEELILLNDKNQIMFDSGHIGLVVGETFNLQNERIYEERINGNNYLIANDNLNFYQWKMLYVLSLEPFEKTIGVLVGFMAATIIVVFILALVLMAQMSKVLCINIEKVSSEMDSFLGNKSSISKNKFVPQKLEILFNKYNMNTKLWIYYITITIIPMILISVVVYGKYQSVTKVEIEKSVNILTDYSYQIIENRLYDETHTLQAVLLNNQLLNNINEYSNITDEVEKKRIYYDICMTLQKVAKDSEIVFFDREGAYIISWPKIEDELYKGVGINIADNEKTVWDSYNRNYEFYMVRRMYQKSKQYVGNIGYVTLEIPENILYGISKGGESDIIYQLADENGIIFSSSNDENLGGRLKESGKYELYYVKDISKYGILVTIAIGESPIVKLNNCLAMLLVTWNVLLCLMVCIQQRRMNEKIIEPINLVNQALIKGDDIDLTKQNGDEIDKLVLSVDQMKKRIDALFAQVYQNEVIARELEMKVLRAQVTPHFLCNTLEQINAMVDMNDKRASDLVVLLGRLFRLGISQEERFVTLQEEISYTEVYIKIHKIILEDRLEVYWEIPQILLHYKMVHFVLQPLVENCLKHGKYIEDDCRRIVIRAYDRKDYITLAVCDNGKGIEKEHLKKIRNNIHCNAMDGESKGLKNVHNRILLNFGEEYGLRIYSVEEKGTIVFVKIPKMN